MEQFTGQKWRHRAIFWFNDPQQNDLSNIRFGILHGPDSWYEFKNFKSGNFHFDKFLFSQTSKPTCRITTVKKIVGRNCTKDLRTIDERQTQAVWQNLSKCKPGKLLRKEAHFQYPNVLQGLHIRRMTLYMTTTMGRMQQVSGDVITMTIGGAVSVSHILSFLGKSDEV